VNPSLGAGWLALLADRAGRPFTCWGGVACVQEKFRLDLSDEQAVAWMQQLIADSANALMPQIVEATHRWAQYWR
jgi:hypothetical protein